MNKASERQLDRKNTWEIIVLKYTLSGIRARETHNIIMKVYEGLDARELAFQLLYHGVVLAAKSIGKAKVQDAFTRFGYYVGM